MAKPKTRYVCQACGSVTARWQGQCVDCAEWNTLVQEAAEVSSNSALESNKLGYQVGVRINIDVLNAQRQLYQTRTDLARARYNTILAGLKLKAAAGSLREEDLQPINALLQQP